MNEEINEFYEAIHKNNKDEILDDLLSDVFIMNCFYFIL